MERTRLAAKSSISADKTYQLALNANAIRAVKTRFVSRVCSFQGDRIASAAQSLQRCFLIIDKGHNDLAGICCVGFLDNDRIAIKDARVDHRVSGHFQRIVIAAPDHATRNRYICDLVLEGFDRRAKSEEHTSELQS